MKKEITLLLILGLLITVPVCVQSEQFVEAEENNIQVFEKMSKVDQSSLGRTLIDTIQLKMESGDHVDDLIKLIEEVKTNLLADQKEDDAYIADFSKQCDTDIAVLNGEIDSAQSRSNDLGSELQIKIPQREQAQKELEQKTDNVQRLYAEIQDLDKKKELKDAEWVQVQEEHDQASFGISKAREIIQQLKKKGSFLQITQIAPVFAQVSEHLQSTLKKYEFKQKSWTSIFALLANAVSAPEIQADQAAVDKIISITDSILNKLHESREIERKGYQAWVNEYQRTRIGHEVRISELQIEIKDLQSKIDILSVRILQATSEKEEQQKRISDKTIQRNDRQQICNSENEAFTQRRKHRLDDIDIVNTVIGLFNQNVKGVQKYVQDRASLIQINL